MEPKDITIEILRGIQATLVSIDRRLLGVDERLAEHGSRLESLERHAIATNESLAKLHDDATLTNETLGLIQQRIVFAEAASSAATTARVRLDDRVDRLEARVDALEAQRSDDG